MSELSKILKDTDVRRKPLGSKKVANNGGGYSYQASDLVRLRRFLTMGTEDGTYYVKAPALTQQNAEVLMRMIAKDSNLVVDELTEISVQGRAKSVEPQIFALAMCIIHGQDKAYARAAVPKVVRTAPHLYTLTDYFKSTGKWNNGMSKALQEWFKHKPADALAYQAVKFRSRTVK